MRKQYSTKPMPSLAAIDKQIDHAQAINAMVQIVVIDSRNETDHSLITLQKKNLYEPSLERRSERDFGPTPSG